MALAITASAMGASALEAPSWARGGDSVEPEGTTTPAAIEQAVQAGLASMSDPPVEDETPQPVPIPAQRMTTSTASTAALPSPVAATNPSGGTGFNPFAAPRPTTLARSEDRAVDTDGALGLPAALAVGALACIGWLLRRLWID